MTTVTVPRHEGIQALAAFEDENSPTEVAFEINGDLEWTDDGLVEVSEPSGETYTVLTPWAKDQDGLDIETYYDIRDGNLVQHVEHNSGTFSYPVVADPWMGIQLFHKWKRDKHRGGLRYSAWITPKGSVVLGGGHMGVGSYAAGQAIFRSNGWNEWKKKWPKITDKKTLQQQYNCHVAAGAYGIPFTQDYNLERVRTNRAGWVALIHKHQCNW